MANTTNVLDILTGGDKIETEVVVILDNASLLKLLGLLVLVIVLHRLIQ